MRLRQQTMLQARLCRLLPIPQPLLYQQKRHKEQHPCLQPKQLLHLPCLHFQRFLTIRLLLSTETELCGYVCFTHKMKQWFKQRKFLSLVKRL